MTTTITSLLTMLAAFFVAIGVIVSVHEFGHFWVARRCGIRVLRFSVGFGNPIWKRTAKDGVEYAVGSIPLGGYVKLLDQREGNVAPADAQFSFNQAKPWKRIATLLAGPFANLLFAVLVYWVLLIIGIPSLKPVIGEVTPDAPAARAGLHVDDLIVAVQNKEVATREAVMMSLLDGLGADALHLKVSGARGKEPARELTLSIAGDRRTLTEPDNLLKGLGFDFWYARMPATVGQVVAGGPADLAGVKAGDTVLTLNDEPIADFQALVNRVSSQPNREVLLKLQRGEQQVSLTVKIGEETQDGRSVGRIGIGAIDPETIKVPDDMKGIQKYGAAEALTRGMQKTWDTSALSLKMMWQMVVGKVSSKNLSGPISIAEYSGVAVRQGLRVFVDWLALISISIGILNLLPLPMLDGGQVVYQLVELLKGSPVSERVQLLSQQVGFAMLLMLLSLTLYNDIARHF